MSRDISTTEALMTDPTTPEGRAYWQERHDYEAALENLRRVHPPHHDVEGCQDCARIRVHVELPKPQARGWGKLWDTLGEAMDE